MIVDREVAVARLEGLGPSVGILVDLSSTAREEKEGATRAHEGEPAPANARAPHRCHGSDILAQPARNSV